MPELDAVFDAWDKTSGRDEDLTRELSDQYVAAYPEKFTQLANMTLEECVKALEVFRSAGFEDDWRTVQVWLWHHFEPQTIGGPVEAKVRLV